jgi:hypothetical protein
VLNVGFEGQGICGSLYAHRLTHTSFEGDRSDQGGVLAAVSWNLAVGPFPLGALALRQVMEVLKPDSSTNTRRLASKREASHRHKPLASSSRSEAICDFFERPASLEQAGYGPADGGGGDFLPKLFLESLAVLY